MDLDSHRTDALIENAKFLFTQGYTREHAAERLGISRDALDQMITRHAAKFGLDGLNPPGYQESLA